MNSSFPNRWSFSYLKFTKYVTNIIAEPKYKYGQQEQVTVRNHNRSTALERAFSHQFQPPVCRSPGVGRNTFLSSPHLCFIIVFICDLFVSRDDPLLSQKTFTRTEQLNVSSHNRSRGRAWVPVKPV